VKILLASAGGMNVWLLLRLMHEGHECEWFDVKPAPRTNLVLKGLVPPPLKKKPDFSVYDLVIFDCTDDGSLAQEAARVTPVIGDSELASKLEDDRLFGIETMEQAGIEVPPYETFENPEEAKQFISENPKRYVYKPFTVDGEEQPCETTYVSDSADDLIRCIDGLFEESHQAPFLLQEVVEGTEISTEGYFDGTYFHLLNHTLEEKKFMSGSYGPNTGCSGNLVWTLDRPNRLAKELMKLAPFLHEAGYHGMIDLNTIVNESHAYGLEFTPRFGYDASASIFSLIDGDLGKFFYDIVTAPDQGYIETSPVPPLRGRWAASVRLTVPPYPAEEADYPQGIPIKGIDIDSAWKDCYLLDAMIDKQQHSGEEGLVTVGLDGIVACPIACAYTPEGAWKGLARIAKPIKFPNMQKRDDLEETTAKRLKEVKEMGWLE
jgi:phosphoribosylamine-glycine ligase